MTFSLEGEPDRQMRMCSRALGGYLSPPEGFRSRRSAVLRRESSRRAAKVCSVKRCPSPPPMVPGPQARQKVGGLQIDDLHLVSRVKDLVRDALRGGEAGDGGDHIAQAFQLLHIHGGIDVNARAKQLGNILVALGVAGSLIVGVGQLIH